VPALTADGLTRRFGDLVAVDGLTFEVPAGGVVGFVGAAAFLSFPTRDIVS
jgi:ABC-type uncharacterized transport system ATPase subunit